MVIFNKIFFDFISILIKPEPSLQNINSSMVNFYKKFKTCNIKNIKIKHFIHSLGIKLIFRLALNRNLLLRIVNIS